MSGFDSRLPDVGTTIFTVMSALAHEHGAINLSQGFPDFDGPELLKSRVSGHMAAGHNQYPPMAGVESLRTSISEKIRSLYGRALSAQDEVTVTAGATEALFCAIAALVRPDDEVIVFDPAYDSYEPAVRLQGGRTVHIPMKAPSFRPDWDRVADAVTERTRLIITNSPHNPSGSVWRDEDVDGLRQVTRDREIYIVADEVYEHIVFDERPHLSMAKYDDLFARSIVISSFGKTYHVTGWKVGYAVAPRWLMHEFRKVHQFVNFTVNTPMQLGLADFLDACPEHHLELSDFYQRKRDRFLTLLAGSRFEASPTEGTYFQTLDFANLAEGRDMEVAKRWTQDIGVASIPISVFYRDLDEAPRSLLRFCFAKDDATLAEAAEILCRI